MKIHVVWIFNALGFHMFTGTNAVDYCGLILYMYRQRVHACNLFQTG
jgi:hypothetical protein